MGSYKTIKRSHGFPWHYLYLIELVLWVQWGRIVACPPGLNSCISGRNVDKCLVDEGFVFPSRLKAVKMANLF